ncbi:MAG TPA: copper resistance CopC family protein [Methylomirabilota bacterium]|nr:copper resistance CopC family protein [Methylomirabilota bacterium]
MSIGRPPAARPIALAGLLAALWSGWAWAHAFPERSEPRVGAVVRASPAAVRIWFDGDLEPAFSRITVTDSRGQRVDRDDARVDPQNRRLLGVGLRPLAPGAYTVRWRVLAVDGHQTEGDYTFTLKGPE